MSIQMSDAARHVEELMQEAFGASLAEYHTNLATAFPRSAITDAIRVVRNSRAAVYLEQWRKDDGVMPWGRKAHLTFESVLVLMLMHVREGSGVLFSSMSHTLAHRLTAADMALIGITAPGGDQQLWYDRLWRAARRMLSLVDPQPGPRRKRPTMEEFQRILAQRDPVESAKKQLRLDFICNALVEGSVEMMPRAYRRKYKGNLAFDASFYGLHGKEGNQRVSDPENARFSINYDGGFYKRGGDHNGADERREQIKWGLELETTTMTANKPGEKADFPLLTIAVGSHRPGAIKLAPKRMFDSIRERGYPAAYVFADTAYLPGAMPDELQGPLREMGYELVFDYGKNELGKTTHYEHAIQVMGQWYLNTMPSDLVNAEALFHRAPRKDPKKRAEAKELLLQRRQAREAYRLKPKGLRRPDGSQQYMYPPANEVLRFDEVTGEILPALEKRTVVIPLKVGLKYGQKFVWKSTKWSEWYGLRSTVEGSYAYMKDPEQEDLESPRNRRARGNTFAYLAVTLAVASSNLRKILLFIQKKATSATPITSKNSKSIHRGTRPSEAAGAEPPTEIPPVPRLRT